MAVGVLARLVTVAGYLLIVADAVIGLWQTSQRVLAVLALIASPITVFVWPVFGDGDGVGNAAVAGPHLWIVLLAAMIAYPISTFVGGLPPIDRPRDLFDPRSWTPVSGRYQHEDFDSADTDENEFLPPPGSPRGEDDEATRADPVYQDYLAHLSERWSALWATSINPLRRPNDEVSDIELAIIKRVVRETALQHVIHTTNYGGEPNSDDMLVEERPPLAVIVADLSEIGDKLVNENLAVVR